MASVVTNDDNTYSLKLSSRGAADITPTLEFTAAGAGTFQLSGGVSTVTSAVAAAVDPADYVASTVEGGVNIATAEAAVTALDTITAAINTKDQARASFGYKMNRLESTIAILDIQSENLQSAESRISDVDVATEMAAMTRTQVLAQAGISMLAQANQMPQMALSLLR